MSTAPCPYCGQTPEPTDVWSDNSRCAACGGLFEPLSRTATQLAMGPWQVRDETKPFMPGFSVEVLRRQIAGGRVKADTILRGPTTYQFWMRADQTPGVSALLGKCHACQKPVEPTSQSCTHCEADLTLPGDTNTLGLMYVTDLERQQAQSQISQGKGAPPPTQLKKTAKPRQRSGVELAADELKPIANPNEQPTPDPADGSEPEDSASTAHAEEDHAGPADAIDDLWAADGDAVAPRRRSRSRGANGGLIAMLVVSLAVIVIGGIVLIGQGGNDAGDDGGDAFSANTGSTDGNDQSTPNYDAGMVKGVRGEAEAQLEQIDDQPTPDLLKPQLEQARILMNRAEAAVAAEDFKTAFDAYTEAMQQLATFAERREKYIEDAELRAEANDAKSAMVQAKLRAEELDAKDLVPKLWQKGEDLANVAEQMMREASFEAASSNYLDAASAYEEAGLLARQADQARTAHEDFNELVKQSAPRQLLEEHAAEEFARASQLRAEAITALNQLDYRLAMDRYNQAADELIQANRLVELARGRKYYAYLAGYAAADALVTLASGDPLSGEIAANLRLAMEALELPADLAVELPASNAKPEDYDELSNSLINRIRTHLIATFGQPVQQSYAIGVQARIVEKTLSFDVMTSDHRGDAGNSVREIESLANQAGWDTKTLAPQLDKFRTELRKDEVGQQPTNSAAAWAEVLAFLSSEDHGKAMMSVDGIEPLDSPELFPE